MVEIKKPSGRRQPAPPPPSYSSPIAILALGMLGGYAALVLLPATGVTELPLWQVALGATIITLLAAAMAVRNCLPFAKAPLRGRLIAGLCLLGCLATGVFTQRIYAHESSTAAHAAASDTAHSQPAEPLQLASLFGLQRDSE